MRLHENAAYKSPPVVCGLLAVLGISFWFFLAFPWDNHNESFLWVVQLDRLGFLGALTSKIVPVANYRPLGTATAWLGYKLSGGTIYPQELMNYLLAALAWLLAYRSVPEKRLFALLAALVSGGFFSGYIFLFHLHGVFYGPLLLFLAYILLVVIRGGLVTTKSLLIVSILSYVVALYHPFALALFLMLMLGQFLEHRTTIPRAHLLLGVLLSCIALALMFLLLPGQGQNVKSASAMMSGLFTAYGMAEVNPILSLLAAALAVAAVLGMRNGWRIKILIGCSVVIAVVFLHVRSQPILVAWIMACLIKVILMRSWSLALLIFTTFFFPLPQPTGSPTYTIFVLLICTVVTALGWAFANERLSIVNRSVCIAVPGIAAVVLIALRLNVGMPIVSTLVRPLLAEKEKTQQMKEIVHWIMNSNYRDYKIEFYEPAESPVRAGDALDRRHRAPTSNWFLQAHMDSLGGSKMTSTGPRLEICFGDQRITGVDTILVVKGKYNGNAMVFKP